MYLLSKHSPGIKNEQRSAFSVQLLRMIPAKWPTITIPARWLRRRWVVRARSRFMSVSLCPCVRVWVHGHAPHRDNAATSTI